MDEDHKDSRKKMNQSKIQNHKSKIIKILIVDDDQRMARTLKDILTVKGHEAVVAHSGILSTNGLRTPA